MYTTNLRKVGGSVMLAVPPALLATLQLHTGAKVGVTVESGRLIVEPNSRPSYTLDELLAQCSPKTRRSKQGPKRRSTREREWVASKPVGRELL